MKQLKPHILQRSESGLPVYGIVQGNEYNGIKKTLHIKEDGSALVMIRKYAHGELEDFSHKLLSKEEVEELKYSL